MRVKVQETTYFVKGLIAKRLPKHILGPLFVPVGDSSMPLEWAMRI